MTHTPFLEFAYWSLQKPPRVTESELPRSYSSGGGTSRGEAVLKVE